MPFVFPPVEKIVTYNFNEIQNATFVRWRMRVGEFSFLEREVHLITYGIKSEMLN